jgi:hypothetical protein
MYEINPTYAKPEVIKKIYELRTKGERWRSIGKIIFEEMGLKITDPTIKNIYNRFVAKNYVVQGAKDGKFAQELISDYQRKMEARFTRITEITDDLMNTLMEIKKRMPPEVYVKYIPTTLLVCREILSQLEFIKKDQTQVLINQKNIIYSPLQIMNILNTELERLAEEGKIEIKDTAKDGRYLTDEEKKSVVFSTIKSDEEIEWEQKEKENNK